MTPNLDKLEPNKEKILTWAIDLLTNIHKEHIHGILTQLEHPPKNTKKQKNSNYL